MATPTEASATSKPAAPKGKKKGPKKDKKNIPHALATVQASFNNTIVSITDQQGNVLAWSSAGRIGFKGSRKGTPFAAQLAAGNAAQIAQESGVRSLDVRVNGPGSRPRERDPRPRRRGHRHPVHQGRDADSAQRLPAAEAAQGLILKNSSEFSSVNRALDSGPGRRTQCNDGIDGGPDFPWLVIVNRSAGSAGAKQ